MPMRYANPADVYAALKIDPTAMDAVSVADRDRAIRVENGLADNFDQEINTSFGVAPVAETRSVMASGAYYDPTGSSSWYAEDAFYDHRWPYYYENLSQMILNTRVRSVSAIRTGGDWNGTTWVDDELVPVDNYVLNYQDQNQVNSGYWGILSLSSAWSGVYRITGIWADQIQLTVPADVREALTFLTIDQYRILKSSPSGTIGPDQMMVQTRNAWSFASVKNAINRHRVVELVI